MKFKTTIIYQEGFKPTPRSRKLRYRDCNETVYTEIKEISKELAPIAFICDNSEYRLYNDKLYVLTSKRDIVCNMEDKTGIEKLTDVFENSSYFYGFNEYDTKEKMIEEANKYANQYIIINNEVWQLSGEPMYEVCTF